MKNKFLSFLVYGFITFSPSFIGGFATYKFKEPWYSNLIQPSFSPPDWIFAPVWTTLYILMTIAIWIIWHSKKKENKIIHLYIAHLFLNATWSIVFFIFHKIFLAVIILIILILFIIILMVKFKQINMFSYYLMIPYLLWCVFALILNTSLLFLN